MKKRMIIIILLLLLFTGCKKKTEPEYKLIEVTAGEVVDGINKGDEFVYASLNPYHENGRKFLEDLEKAAKELKINIYYVDNTKISIWASLILDATTSLNADYLYYTGKEYFVTEYKNYDSIIEKLKGKEVKEFSTLKSEDELKENLKKAEKLYEEGKINESYTYICGAWSLKDAKEFYRSHPYYNILSKWVYKKETGDKLTIKKLAAFETSDIIYYYEYNGKTKKYEEPTAPKYKEQKYYIKDDIIYTSKDGKEYKEKYQILSISNRELGILIDGKAYKFVKE